MAYSAALCRGLIEAVIGMWAGISRIVCIPRLYAAASLKPAAERADPPFIGASIPRLYAAASLKRHGYEGLAWVRRVEYSAALCRGLIEATTV